MIGGHMLENTLGHNVDELDTGNNSLDTAKQRQHAESVERNRQWFTEIFALIPKNSQAALEYDGNCLKAWLAENPTLILNDDLYNNEDVLKQYFTEMIESELKRATIVRHKASVKMLLSVMNLANPFTQSSLFNKWLGQALKQKSGAQKQAESMGIDALNLINEKLSNDCPLQLRNKIILNIGFDALLRASEICAIKIEHIDFASNTVFIPSSKTDQEGQGEDLHLTNTTLALISQWIVMLPKKTGYLLRSLSPKKHIRNAPLQYRTVLDTFRSASVLAGKEYGYFTGHSGRVGGAVTLAESGASLLDIQRAGRWANATMPAAYTKKASAKLTGMGNIAEKLGR